jgi:hypothetical protein
MFGLEYQTEATKSYRFFALEADRGTMPVSRTKPGQTSYLGKLAAYRQAIGSGAHKAQWGIPNLLVLTITTSQSRLAEFLRAGDGGGWSGFLFKVVGARDLHRPMPGLLTEPWARIGTPPLSIS